VSEHELSLIPLEARPYQGTTAGIVTRTVANTIDGVVVAVALAGAWFGVIAFQFILSPRDFQAPAAPIFWCVAGYLYLLVTYLTAAWWISGRTIGDHLMGIRVVTGNRRRLRFLRAWARALLCAFFPVGLLWCMVSPQRRSVQDVLLRTRVIYDWLPRPTAGKDATGSPP
jgi:uncharacterized RDD family membrane protein YckC